MTSAAERPPLTEDSFLGGKLKILQPAKGYRAGIDAVLLAASLQAQAGAHVLDLGCGVGTAGLCLMGRLPEVRVTGLELQDVLCAIARKNLQENGLEGRWDIIQGDLLHLPDELPLGGFDHVISNPPFMPRGASHVSGDPIKALANHEGEASLRDWILAALKLVKHKGSVTLVHRADRLDEILAVLREKKAGDIHVFPLWPYAGQAAKRVIVWARRGVAKPLVMTAGQVLHNEDGSYTTAVEAVLRHGAALPI